MKKLMKLFAVLIILSVTACKDGKTKVSVVERPDITVENVNYVGNRAPLQPLHFIKLPVGDIMPKGWIHRYLILQKEGLTGRLGEISAWVDKSNNAWLQEGAHHGWEEAPYWLKGYANIGYILHDEEMLQEAQIWLDAILNQRNEDGSFGPINDAWGAGVRELWANMIVLWCLQSYYEYTSDQRVIDLMDDYFRWQLTLDDVGFLDHYWENSRGGDNLLSVYWLYNITGEEYLLELAEKIHRNTADWMQKSTLPNWHNVNVAQGFREPATYYMLTGDSAHLQATYNVYDLVRRTFGQVPGGMFGADENARMGYIDPRQGTETCGFVEQMASDEILLRMTGDPFWAESCEDIAFNSYPAAVMPDFKGLRYITSPNLVLSDGENHHPGIDNRGPFLNMNPFSSRCCQHNHAQGWPYYAEHLVLASPDNGLAVALYGACTARVKVGEKDKEIILHEESNYPFEETVRFTIESEEDVEFPFYLRVPTWCENSVVKINNKTVIKNPTTSHYVRLEREWKNGDVVTLELPMSLSMRQWQVNKNSVSIDYGPLTFSLLIEEEYEKVDSKETAIHDSKWQEGADPEAWPSYNIYPKSDWNYALLIDSKDPLKNFKLTKRAWPVDDFPFTLDAVPLMLEAKGRQIPSWQIDQFGLCDVLPEEDALKSERLDNIKLVPMGAARLRISAFPTVDR